MRILFLPAVGFHSFMVNFTHNIMGNYIYVLKTKIPLKNEIKMFSVILGTQIGMYSDL